MKSKDLLNQLTRMERSLHDFSFEELTSSEATQLKKSFEAFKIKLENNIFQPQVSGNLHSEMELVQALPEKTTTAKDEGTLIAHVSHEIRTPLNGIIGFTDLLKEDSTLNEKQLEQVNAIQKASYSLMEIINELLEYSKLAAGLERFETVNFGLRNVVGDVVYLCRTLISSQNVILTTEIDDHIPEVLLGDPSKLTQILLNLLGNAVKFVERGNIHLKISVKKEQLDALVLDFELKDTGIGIAENQIKHIFESYKQAEKNTFMKYGGTGLGLNIVMQIIENLNGAITVSSKLGVGTTFTFSIPYKLGSPKNLPQLKTSPILEKERALVNTMRILVFEDNLLNQKLITQRLEAWGCKVHITANAHVGMKILEDHCIDLILMDLKMPEMSGFEITKLIRNGKNQNIRRIPIIALSADFSAKDKQLCDVNGINDFILKPYNADELLSKLIQNCKNMNNIQTVASPSIDASVKKNIEEDKIDLSMILEQCMGEVTLLKELILLYKQNALEFIGASRRHLLNEDIEQLEFAAHKIKSGLKMLKSNSLLSIIEQIQLCCKTDRDLKHIDFLLNCFTTEYPSVEKQIDLAMKELKKQ